MKQRRLQKCQAYFAFFYSSPELGVPTSFADISEFEAVCEVEEKAVDVRETECTLFYDLEKNHLLLKM